MKKFSPILAAVLCVTMLTPSVSAADRNAYTLYQDAIEEVSSLASLEYRTSLTVVYDGEEISNQYKTQQVRKKDAIDALRITYFENGNSLKRYYKDRYQYTHVGGKHKRKSSLPLNDTMLCELPTDLSKELFINAKVEKTVTGKRVVVTMPSPVSHGIVANLDDFEYLKKLAGKMDVKHVFYFDASDRLTRYQILLFHPEWNGQDMNFTADYKITSRNEIKAIAFPDDLDLYVDDRAAAK